MARTDVTAINAKTISINGVPISGSAAPSGNVTTWDQLDADAVLALNGVVVQGAATPGMVFSNYENINVLSGVSVGDTVRYGMASTPATNGATGPLNPFTGPVVLPSVEQAFTYAQVEPAWTLVRSEKDPSFLQLNNKTDASSASHYAALITGSSAAGRLSDFLKTTATDRANDLYFEVSVDGGPYVRTPYNATQDDYQLFTGLADTQHLVAMRTPAARDQFTYIPKAQPPLRVTGAAPAVKNVNQWLQPGAPNANVHVASGLITINDLLDANSGNLWRPQKFGHYLPGGVASMMFRANVQEMIFVTNQRLVHLFDGTTMTVLDTGADATSISSTGIRTVRATGLSGLKTYWVWTSNNSSLLNYFAVGLIGGTAVTPAVPKRTIDQYGDSITQGSAPDGVGGDSVAKLANGRGYVDTFRVAARLGYTGSANGVGGYSVADLNNNIAEWLATKTITSADVALVAIGQNGGVPDTSVYNAIIDKLLAKGYGTVVCRGVIPVSGGGSDAINTIIANIVSARNDPKVKYMNVNSWTTISRQDGIHPDIAGYGQMVPLGVAALGPLIPA